MSIVDGAFGEAQALRLRMEGGIQWTYAVTCSVANLNHELFADRPGGVSLEVLTCELLVF
jgi:hypothetical protein